MSSMISSSAAGSRAGRAFRASASKRASDQLDLLRSVSNAGNGLVDLGAAPGPMAKKQNKCQLNRKKAFSHGYHTKCIRRSLASTEHSLMETGNVHWRPQSVLSWIPFEMHWNSQSVLSWIHRAFSHGHHSRCIGIHHDGWVNECFAHNAPVIGVFCRRAYLGTAFQTAGSMGTQPNVPCNVLPTNRLILNLGRIV